jgi:hypothetical protein
LNEIPFVRVGRRVLFRVESIEAWLKDKEASREAVHRLL